MTRRTRRNQQARPSRRGPRGIASPRRPSHPPSVGELAEVIVGGGEDLAGIEDPLEAEIWASAMLGTFYKVNTSLTGRDELEQTLWPTVVRKAESAGDAKSLAVLEALAAVTDEKLADDARAAADRLRRNGVPAPSWAARIGSAAFESAWMMTDVFGDHEAYLATLRYPGRKPHVVNALYDKAMGEIVKDGFVGYVDGDPRVTAGVEPGVTVVDAVPGPMARRLIDAIASGDLYLDNDWTLEFKRFRALILARMRLLPFAPSGEPPGPPNDDERDSLIAEFMASAVATGNEYAEVIVRHCLDYSCDYLGDSPVRWSPIVAEQFLLDYLPRKVSLSLGEVRAVPAVVRRWVRFALTKRGLEERWITETEDAVDQFAKAFRSAMTDRRQFGPAKAIGTEMLASGVDPTNQAAVDRWVEAFNRRPQAERDELLGRWPFGGDGPDESDR